MVSFPNCKINLGLNIVRKRTDGYHDLETIFLPIPLFDIIEVVAVESKNDPEVDIQLTISGNILEDEPKNNLCYKAYQILKKDFPDLPKVQIHLHKVIPTGAGLGGGSADGAFMLALLNDKFDLRISKEKLLEYSLQLGSDCPFFILNKPCFASGRGEVLHEINIDLSDYKILLVNPGIHVSTASAFSEINPEVPARSLKEIISRPVSEWKNEMRNDFEKSVFKNYPEIQKIKNDLYQMNAEYVSMTGSGSSVFGLFKKEVHINRNFPSTYFVKELFCKF